MKIFRKKAILCLIGEMTAFDKLTIFSTPSTQWFHSTTQPKQGEVGWAGLLDDRFLNLTLLYCWPDAKLPYGVPYSLKIVGKRCMCWCSLRQIAHLYISVTAYFWFWFAPQRSSSYLGWNWSFCESSFVPVSHTILSRQAGLISQSQTGLPWAVFWVITWLLDDP